MGRKIILSTAYFGTARYFSKFLLEGKVLIEAHETYTKQTYRNRCVIATANGPLSLSVPVQRGSFHKVAIRDLKIDTHTRWHKIHSTAIVSAYTHSPYFEFYRDAILAHLQQPAKFLFDFNLEITATILRILSIDNIPAPTDTFIHSYGDAHLDYRTEIIPRRVTSDPRFSETEYPQVFNDRSGFLPGLSILDTVFNLGPGTLTHLRNCIKKEENDLPPHIQQPS